MFHYLVGWWGDTGDGARLFPEVQGERTKCCSQVAAREIAAGYKEESTVKVAVLEEVVQRDCGVSIPEISEISLCNLLSSTCS